MAHARRQSALRATKFYGHPALLYTISMRITALSQWHFRERCCCLLNFALQHRLLCLSEPALLACMRVPCCMLCGDCWCCCCLCCCCCCMWLLSAPAAARQNAPDACCVCLCVCCVCCESVHLCMPVRPVGCFSIWKSCASTVGLPFPIRHYLIIHFASFISNYKRRTSVAFGYRTPHGTISWHTDTAARDHIFEWTTVQRVWGLLSNWSHCASSVVRVYSAAAAACLCLDCVPCQIFRRQTQQRHMRPTRSSYNASLCYTLAKQPSHFNFAHSWFLYVLARCLQKCISAFLRN